MLFTNANHFFFCRSETPRVLGLRQAFRPGLQHEGPHEDPRRQQDQEDQQGLENRSQKTLLLENWSIGDPKHRNIAKMLTQEDDEPFCLT